MPKVFQMNDKVFVGLSGLATDMQTLEQKFRFRTNMYRLREERDIGAKAFSSMVSALLYEKRFSPFFCVVVAGVAMMVGIFARGIGLEFG